MTDTTDRLKGLASKAKEKEIANILRKLNDGKTLTAAESKRLAEFERENQKTLSQVEVANEWGVTKMAVSKMVAAGMPLTSFEAAEKWREENIRNPKKGPTAQTIQAAKLDILLLDAEKKRLLNARLKREQVSFSAVNAAWQSVLYRIKSYIENCDQLSRSQAAEITKQIHAEITGAESEIEACVFASQSEEDSDSSSIEGEED